MKPVRITLFILLLGGLVPWNGFATESAGFGAQIAISEKFNHEMHDLKVFRPNKIECSKCHNFSLDPSTGKLNLQPQAQEKTLKFPLRKVCHECHQGAEAKYEAAPKTCFTCHASATSLGSIRPQNHANVIWKKAHGAEARVSGSSCLNCHTTSQCVKCHTQRNDVDMKNHPRNFRFVHSVEARLQPQRCDACHTKSYCVDCHVGRKK